MQTFIEYLLESREEKLSGHKSKKLLNEHYEHANIQNGTLKLSQLQEILQGFEQTDRVRFVYPIENGLAVKNFRNEFGWQPGSDVAELQSIGQDDQFCLVSDLLRDIQAIGEAGGNLQQINVRATWDIGGSSRHDHLKLGWDSEADPQTLWIAVDGTDAQLQSFVTTQAATIDQPQAPAAQPQPALPQAQAQAQAQQQADGADGADDDEQLEEVNGQRFKELEPAALRSMKLNQQLLALESGPVILWKGSYGEFLRDFRQLTQQESTFFKTGDKTAIRYHAIDWDENVDSFVKRLGFMKFYREGNTLNVVMQLLFNGHKAVVGFKNISQYVLKSLASEQCSRWFKSMVRLYLESYKTSRNGIQVLFDPDHFFRKNSKYNIQQDPPFTIGLAVPSGQNATPDAQPQTGARNAQPPAAARRPAPQPRGERAANMQLKTQIDQMFKQSKIAGFEAFVGRENSKDIPKTFQDSSRSNYCMAIEIPGALYQTFRGNEAIQFLQRMRLWDGKVKPAYELAKAQHEDLELVIYPGASLPKVPRAR